MNRRPLMVFCLIFLIGIIYSLTFSICIIFAVSGLILYYMLTAGTGRIIYIRCILFVISFALGFLRGYSCSKDFENAKGMYPDGSYISVEARIDGKEIKGDYFYYYIDTYPGIYVCSENGDHMPGDHVAISGKVRYFSKAENEGNFDEEDYYRSKGMVFYIMPESIRLINRPTFSIVRSLFRVKTAMEEETGLHLPGEEPALMSGIMLGDKAGMDEEMKNIFSILGLLHIMAVSGMHISAVGSGLYGGARKHFGILISALLSAPVAAIYCMICGSPVSGVRATILFVIFLMAGILGEAYDALTAIGVAALIIAAFSPYAVTGTSFILSFGVTTGIFVIVLPLMNGARTRCRLRWERLHKKEKGNKYKPGIKGRIGYSIFFSMLIQISSLPISLYFFYTMSPYTMLLNLLILPLLPFVLVIGLLASITGIILPGTIGYAISDLMFYPCHIIIYLYEMVADHTVRMPFSRIISGRPALISILIYYAVLCGSTAFLSKKRRKYEVKALKDEIRTGRSRKKPLTVGERIELYIPVLTVLLCPVFLLLPRPKPPEIDMLSVGQGEAIYITDGNTDIMIDSGSTSVKNAGRYRIEPFLLSRGIRGIDYYFITHMDEDHMNGCLELLERGYPIDRLLISEFAERNENYDMLLDAAETTGTEIIYVKEGDRLVLEEGALTVLYPGSDKKYDGGNENSLVMLLRNRGVDMVFTGDIGADQEKYILSRHNELNDIDILKAAHHGSNNSNCTDWLEALSPDVAVISAGKNNVYGHPGSETIERLDALGISYFCTIDRGEIRIFPRGGEFYISDRDAPRL